MTCWAPPSESISSQLPGNGYNYTYTFTNGALPVSQVKVTLPDSSARQFWFDPAGYLTLDVRNPGSSAETTVFTRGLQTIGAVGQAAGTTEFIGEVQEEDSNNNVLRQTTYNYDTLAGNTLNTTISPAPGQSSCCSTSATWSYTYTTFNRVASAVEPLAYNGTGTTYTYIDPPSTPTMTVKDPLGRTTTITYNGQGQPISANDPIGNTSSISYNFFGDVQSITDEAGATATYQTDQDGRVVEVTSPLNEVTTYQYDALDDVVNVDVDPSGLNLQSSYAYDLIGEIASSTNPKGNTTTWTRIATLAKTTVKDPLGRTTVTNLDGQGRSTNFTDKRGIETVYTVDILAGSRRRSLIAITKPGIRRSWSKRVIQDRRRRHMTHLIARAV